MPSTNFVSIGMKKEVKEKLKKVQLPRESYGKAIDRLVDEFNDKNKKEVKNG